MINSENNNQRSKFKTIFLISDTEDDLIYIMTGSIRVSICLTLRHIPRVKNIFQSMRQTLNLDWK